MDGLWAVNRLGEPERDDSALIDLRQRLRDEKDKNEKMHGQVREAQTTAGLYRS